MNIAEVHSHLNGLEFLRIRKPELWREIQSIVSNSEIDEQCCATSDERALHGLVALLQSNGWASSETSPTVLFKDRVAIEVQFGNRGSHASSLFARHLASYVCDEIDVGINVLPTNTLRAKLPNVIRNGRGVPGVPLVMVGIAP